MEQLCNLELPKGILQHYVQIKLLHKKGRTDEGSYGHPSGILSFPEVK